MSLLKAFNNHFKEFMDDIISIFPKDHELKTTKFFLDNILKVKPRMVIEVWKENILDLYKEQIEQGDLDFFINKDYSNDVGMGINGNGETILNSIEKMRTKIRDMSDENKAKSVKYIQNLAKLCNLYYLSK